MVFEVVQAAADWLVYTVLDLSPTSQAGSALNFFIYDTVKIFILLLVIIYGITFLRSFFTSLRRPGPGSPSGRARPSSATYVQPCSGS